MYGENLYHHTTVTRRLGELGNMYGENLFHHTNVTRRLGGMYGDHYHIKAINGVV